MQPREPYNSDVSDREWKILCPFFPEKGRLGRPPRYEKREVFNAIQYVTKTGCAWRDVPHDLPPWRLVYHYFSKWQKLGLWQKFNDVLRDKVRAKHGKKKPRLRASSTLRRLKWLINPENAAMMQARRW